MIVRLVRQDDHTVIRDVVTAAFGRPDEAGMIEAVRAGGQALVEFAAEDEAAIVGHILFSRMTCWPAALVAGLAPLAVAPQSQGRGIGGALVHAGLVACRAQGVDGCVVLGSPSYYGRFGFRRAPASIDCRYSPLEAFQALEFTSGTFARPLALAYPPAFD